MHGLDASQQTAHAVDGVGHLPGFRGQTVEDNPRVGLEPLIGESFQESLGMEQGQRQWLLDVVGHGRRHQARFHRLFQSLEPLAGHGQFPGTRGLENAARSTPSMWSSRLLTNTNRRAPSGPISVTNMPTGMFSVIAEAAGTSRSSSSSGLTPHPPPPTGRR
jgi:hypothetical protein